MTHNVQVTTALECTLGAAKMNWTTQNATVAASETLPAGCTLSANGKLTFNTQQSSDVRRRAGNDSEESYKIINFSRNVTEHNFH